MQLSNDSDISLTETDVFIFLYFGNYCTAARVSNIIGATKVIRILSYNICNLFALVLSLDCNISASLSVFNKIVVHFTNSNNF